MKSIKKLLATNLLVVVAIVSSCNKKEEEQTNTNNEITYRTWDTGTVEENSAERRLVAEFEKEFNCKVNIVENVASGDEYWTQIKASVIKNTAADVFMTSNIPWALEDQFALDITSYIKDDEDWNNISSSLKDAVKFKSGTYAIPCRLNVAGLFINEDICADLDVNIDENSSFDKVIELLRKAKDSGEYYGINHVDKLYEVLPSVYDSNLGYYSWDGAKFNLDSDAFVSSINKAKEIYDSKYSFDSLSLEETRNIQTNGGFTLGEGDDSDPVIEAWDQGRLAIRYGFSYELPDMLSKNSRANYRFVGVPGGKTPIIGDYYCIYKNSKNPELAYKFAKYMSFGKQGLLKRFEVYREDKKSGKRCNTLPISQSSDVVNKYFELFPNKIGNAEVKGFKEVYDNLKNGASIEGVKVVPGYTRARWTSKTDLTVTIPNPSDAQNPIRYEKADIGQYLDACVKGDGNINEKKGQLNELANKAYNNWINNNSDKYN